MTKPRTHTEPTLYHDGGRAYLELHAMRAPVGHYLPKYERTPEMYDWAVRDAIAAFERLHNVTILQLGRSGRHICLADTPANRKRYGVLQRSAVACALDPRRYRAEISALGNLRDE